MKLITEISYQDHFNFNNIPLQPHHQLKRTSPVEEEKRNFANVKAVKDDKKGGKKIEYPGLIAQVET